MNESSLFEIKSNEDIIRFVKSCPKIEYTDSFRKILNFYLFECPTTKYKAKSKKDSEWKVSVRSKQFREYGYEKKQLLRLLNYMKQQIDIRFVENFSESNTIKGQFLRLKSQTDMSRVSSIFYSIRNAFAHGSFIVKSGVYTFVFSNSKRTKILGYGKLMEKTLVDWIGVIKSGKIPEPQNHKKKKEKLSWVD